MTLTKEKTMSIIKRISTSLFTSIDQMVGEIENHDALIKAVISEQRKKLASARVQLRRVREKEKKARKDISDLTLKHQTWARRAVEAAGAETPDEEKALACLQRRQSTEAQIERLKSMEREYHQAGEKMSAEIKRAEEELRNMEQKHQLMRARQTSVDAVNVVNSSSVSDLEELDTSFERWEVRLAQGEYLAGGNLFEEEVDELEQSYVSEENRVSLRLELEALMNEEKDHDSK
jgi:phage shock protein A